MKQFDVAGQNYIIGPKLDAIHMSEIDQFDFNSDGSWLATVWITLCNRTLGVKLIFRLNKKSSKLIMLQRRRGFHEV